MRLIIKDVTDATTIEEVNYQDSTQQHRIIVVPNIGEHIVITKGTPSYSTMYKVEDKTIIYNTGYLDAHQTVVLLVKSISA